MHNMEVSAALPVWTDQQCSLVLSHGSGTKIVTHGVWASLSYIMWQNTWKIKYVSLCCGLALPTTDLHLKKIIPTDKKCCIYWLKCKDRSLPKLVL